MGEWQDEPYINPQETAGQNIDIIIPNGELWLWVIIVGNSTDSRSFGTVKECDIVGKTIFEERN